MVKRIATMQLRNRSKIVLRKCFNVTEIVSLIFVRNRKF